MMIGVIVLVLLAAYLLGALPTAVWFSRALGHDVRGLDQAGTSGMVRQFGWRIGLTVFFIDVAKGALAVALAWWLLPGQVVWAGLAMLTVVAGNCWPVFLGFRGGGQGLATVVGALGAFVPLALFWAALVMGAAAGAQILAKRAGQGWTARWRAIPFASLFALPTGVVLLWLFAGPGALLCGLATVATMAGRGWQVMRAGQTPDKR
jgi:acyl phosphate:glycerol-3-phosphate acyltransferase